MENKITSEDPFHFTPLWNAVLDIYLEFAAICERHGLRHYVIGGTLLGAVRHKGFIPWDDDFDLAMPRQDYDKFKELAKTELPQHFQWMDRHNTPEFRSLFGKVMDCRREKIAELEHAVGHQLSNGLFIDVFPVDGYYLTGFAALKRKWSEFVCQSVVRFLTRKGRPPAKTLAGKVSTFAGGLLIPFCPHLWGVRKCGDRAENIFRSLPFVDDRVSGLNGVNCGAVQMVFKPGLFSTPVQLPFEGIKVAAPAQYLDFLAINYGDYMKLPPEDKRVPSHEYAARCPWWLGPTKD